MLGYVVDELGSASIRSINPPKLRSFDVLVDVAACGVNFADLLMIEGTYQEKHDRPFCPGMEISGVITAAGAQVKSLKVGDRVAGFPGHGGLAEQAVVEAERCIRLPDSIPFDVAAAFQVAYGTSHLALSHKARLVAGETLLVLGAAGGVGLTAVELGKLMGAKVIAVVRGVEKHDAVRQAGADHVLDSESPDLRQQIKDLGGADVVYDPVGGELFNTALRATNPDGRILVIGFASGTVPPIPANILLVKNITVIGFYWSGYLKFAPKVITDSLEQLLAWYSDGKLHLHISHKLPLAQADQALALLRDRKSTGKVVVLP
ncbi:NADPH:quinone oxidoreductase family protein [Falsihalocynthiibacter arcticus]|uniref:Zinc-binding dehydrogenase n=1 Tax=Falsihalocynthiibacter arcticus TaxID=1579316 RepID=A0A126UVE4_9RHOB|nr:zinc-binding dehydrogenase [Falsihalocynthiibacter arcticus]